MTDTREDILERLLAICQSVPGVSAVRNVAEYADGNFPLLNVVDGEETTFEDDPNQTGLSKRRVSMLPVIVVMVSDEAEFVGPQLNALRATILNSVLSDGQLQGLTHKGRGAAYMGAAFGVARGRATQGAMELTFRLTYILDPSNLLAT